MANTAPLITFRSNVSPYGVLSSIAYVQSALGGNNLPVLQGENSNLVSFRIYNNWGLSGSIANAVNVRLGAFDSAISHAATKSVINQSWVVVYEAGFGENALTPGPFTAYSDILNALAIGGTPAGTDVYQPPVGSDGTTNARIRAGTSNSGLGFVEFASYVEMPDAVGMASYSFVLSVQYEWAP